MHFKRFFGWDHNADGTSEATAWFSIAYLPIVPLARYKLIVRTSPTETANVQTGGIPFVYVTWQIDTEDDFELLEHIPMEWMSVIVTYINAYILMPTILLIPAFLLYHYGDSEAEMNMIALQLVLWGLYIFLFVPGWLSFLIRRVRGIGAFKYR